MSINEHTICLVQIMLNLCNKNLEVFVESYVINSISIVMSPNKQKNALIYGLFIK